MSPPSLTHKDLERSKRTEATSVFLLKSFFKIPILDLMELMEEKANDLKQVQKTTKLPFDVLFYYKKLKTKWASENFEISKCNELPRNCHIFN